MQAKINFPTLSESAFLRYFNFAALYFAEGLAQGMLFVGIPAWMAMQGKSPSEIGQFAVACSVPWTFKFIIAPLMDRYTYLPMGRKRPWVLFGHLGLMLSIIAFAFVDDPLNNLNKFLAAAFLVSSFGAMQDAAGDAMAVDVVPADQQARANGYMQGSRMVGSSLSLVLCSWILNEYGFKASMLTLFFLVALITIVPIVIREHKGEKILPFTTGKASETSQKLQISNWSVILKALFNVFRLRNSLLVVILLFITQGAYNFFEHLLPIFAVKITGWTNVVYSQAFATADLIGGIIGMLAGGYLIERFGKKRMINIYFLLIVLLVLALNFAGVYWQNTNMLYGFIIVYRLLNAIAKIGVFAIAMQCCSKNISASQFTIFMTMGAVGSIAGASLVGPIKENFNWNISFIFFELFIGLAWLILQFINIEKHVAKIAELEHESTKSLVDTF
ncbi:MFS transporter [Haliscomenobacter sp.]|uniref:MFS transporter n=1 Tax=Haliscomenobacter sp. TaxID=2717303 RepID=UPI003364CE31